MMKYVIGLGTGIWLWLASWFRRAPEPLRTVHLEELPEDLDPGAAYVLGEGKNKWFVVMLCPCGCGKKVEVSLLSDAEPRWRLIEHADKTISLEPSVWRRVGCRSHFFVRRGFIEWCGR